MFNFIFEGKLGEILAPVVSTNKLFLAIQHSRNDEVQGIIDSKEFDLTKLNDSGYGAIHVACRYDNKFALELLLSQGIPSDFRDKCGNTPLHYSAQYGNMDICKLLIQRGCSPTRRNNLQQTAYDTSNNPNIRQYLLPLQFQYEREEDISNGTSTNQLGISSSQSYGYSHSQENLPSYSSAPLGPPTNRALQTQDFSPFSGYTQTQMSYGSGPPPPAFEATVPTYNIPTPTSTVTGASTASRTIKADGFHSSASDPKLQQKYGHTREIINIAPPPISGSVNYNQTQGVPGQGGIYSRYVAYDAHTNSAATTIPHQSDLFVDSPPANPVQNTETLKSDASKVLMDLAFDTAPCAATAPPPSPSPLTSYTAPVMAQAPPVFSQAPQQCQDNSSMVDSNSNPTELVTVSLDGNSPMNVYNPSTDCDVEVLDCNSSAVL